MLSNLVHDKATATFLGFINSENGHRNYNLIKGKIYEIEILIDEEEEYQVLYNSSIFHYENKEEFVKVWDVQTATKVVYDQPKFLRIEVGVINGEPHQRIENHGMTKEETISTLNNILNKVKNNETEL
jgi:hypothetical protein